MALYTHSSQDMLNVIAGPTASIAGTAIASLPNATGMPQHNGFDVALCKGIFLNAAGTAGYLGVHLVDDPVGTWYAVYLVPGAVAWTGLFDLVSKTGNGTTVALDAKLTIFPYTYA